MPVRGSFVACRTCLAMELEYDRTVLESRSCAKPACMACFAEDTTLAVWRRDA